MAQDGSLGRLQQPFGGIAGGGHVAEFFSRHNEALEIYRNTYNLYRILRNRKPGPGSLLHTLLVCAASQQVTCDVQGDYKYPPKFVFQSRYQWHWSSRGPLLLVISYVGIVVLSIQTSSSCVNCCAFCSMAIGQGIDWLRCRSVTVSVHGLLLR